MAQRLGAPALAGIARERETRTDGVASCQPVAKTAIVCLGMRMTISLRDEQAQRLEELCRNEGISRAEAVRRAVSRYLAHHRQREDVFGIWRGRATQGLASERPLRDEWR